MVGFIPGLNTVDLNGNTSATNVFATKADPYCVPMDAKTGNPVSEPPITTGDTYSKNSDGTYQCDSNTVPERVLAFRQLNNLPAATQVPVDAVTASASGLDPDISVANADLQAASVAAARNLPLSTVMGLIHSHTDDPQCGVSWGREDGECVGFESGSERFARVGRLMWRGARCVFIWAPRPVSGRPSRC